MTLLDFHLITCFISFVLYIYCIVKGYVDKDVSPFINMFGFISAAIYLTIAITYHKE